MTKSSTVGCCQTRNKLSDHSDSIPEVFPMVTFAIWCCQNANAKTECNLQSLSAEKTVYTNLPKHDEVKALSHYCGRTLKNLSHIREQLINNNLKISFFFSSWARYRLLNVKQILSHFFGSRSREQGTVGRGEALCDISKKRCTCD